MKEERRPPLTFQFKEGYYAFARGWLRNQYNEDSVKGKEWQRGWNKAYFDNLEEVKRKGLV
jgi:hypothetical protein